MRPNIRLSFLLFIFFSLHSIVSLSQSKFEFGLGVAISHSDMNLQSFSAVGPLEDQYKLLRLPAITSRIGYKYSDRIHFNSGVGFSWLGALNRDQKGRIIASSIEIPLQLEYNILPSFHVSSGLIYNYVYGIKGETQTTTNDFLDEIHTRHQMGFKHRIAYSHKLVELFVSYAHYFTNVLEIAEVDTNGNEFATLVSKFTNVQIGFIVRR